MSSKYAEYDARAAEADKRISELAARVAAMEKAGSGGGDSSALAKENAELKKKVASLEAQLKAGGGDKPAKEDKKGKAEKPAKEAKEAKADKPAKEEKKGGKEEKQDDKKATDDKKEKDLWKAALKEGGKKGQDICGLNEMGGVRFFHLALDNAFGRFDLMEETLKGFNTEIDEAAEERKGGAGHLGKCLLSANDDFLRIVCFVPADAAVDCSAKEWVNAMMPELGKGAKVVSETETTIKVEAPADQRNNLYPLKMRDTAINLGFDLLKKRKLVVDAGSDDDMDYGAMADEAGITWGAESTGGDY